MLPLALLLLAALTSNQARMWVGAAAVLSIALLTHIGVAVLATAWLSLLWVVLVLRSRPITIPIAYSLMLSGSIVIALTLVYGPFVQFHLEQLSQSLSTTGDTKPDQHTH